MALGFEYFCNSFRIASYNICIKLNLKLKNKTQLQVAATGCRPQAASSKPQAKQSLTLDLGYYKMY